MEEGCCVGNWSWRVRVPVILPSRRSNRSCACCCPRWPDFRRKGTSNYSGTGLFEGAREIVSNVESRNLGNDDSMGCGIISSAGGYNVVRSKHKRGRRAHTEHHIKQAHTCIISSIVILMHFHKRSFGSNVIGVWHRKARELGPPSL